MDLNTLIANINKEIINPVILLLFAVALIVFMWGLVEFIANTDSDEAKQKGRRHMIWGVIGMAIMLSALGIKNVIIDTFGL